MRKALAFWGFMLCSLSFNSSAIALSISNSDLWQDATISSFSSAHSAVGGNLNGVFDGQEAGYGHETGNAIFADGSAAGTTHWLEWNTNQAITINSIHILTYHDFDVSDINDRGLSEIRLYYLNGTEWNLFYGWQYTNPNNDFHYGGGPSHQFNPDPQDMTRSYWN